MQWHKYSMMLVDLPRTLLYSEFDRLDKEITKRYHIPLPETMVKIMTGKKQLIDCEIKRRDKRQLA